MSTYSTLTRPIILFTGVICILFWMVSCAQQRPLTGGAKDKTPPVIEASSPQNYSRNFNGNSIAFEFDEYIQVSSLSSELIVSPPLKKTPSYTLKGRKLIFTLEDTLLPNTTYTFNFGEAIKDFNEGNPLDSNILVFSTGNAIDSGHIAGKVIDAYTGKPAANASVMLFHPLNDSAAATGNPMYLTKTNGKGEFELKYLKDMDFQIFATEFTGANYTLVPFEKVAFYPTLVSAHGHAPIDLELFKETDTTQYISKEMVKSYYSFIVGYHSNLENPKFSFIPTSETYEYIVEEIAPDSFKFWITNDTDLDSVTLFVKDDLGVNDTIQFDLDDRAEVYKKLQKKDRKMARPNVRLNTTALAYFDTLFLNYSRPLLRMNPDSIAVAISGDTSTMTSLISSGKMDLLFQAKLSGTSSEIHNSAIIYAWEPNQTYGFILYPGAVVDNLNLTNDTTTLVTKTQSFEDYGSFRFNVELTDYTRPLVLELLDEKGKVFKSYMHEGGTPFEIYESLFVPGKYRVRLILDANGNKKWDTGSLHQKRLPEKVIYYSGQIEIRPNWDMEETWKINLE